MRLMAAMAMGLCMSMVVGITMIAVMSVIIMMGTMAPARRTSEGEEVETPRIKRRHEGRDHEQDKGISLPRRVRRIGALNNRVF